LRALKRQEFDRTTGAKCKKKKSSGVYCTERGRDVKWSMSWLWSIKERINQSKDRKKEREREPHTQSQKKKINNKLSYVCTVCL